VAEDSPAPGWRHATRLGLKTLCREWRAGELRVLAGALIVAVAGVVAVTAFIDRMDRGMQAGATELLAADLLVSSTNHIDDRFRDKGLELGLATARTLIFRSVAVTGELFALSFLKAVGEGYPLRGELRTAVGPASPDEVTRKIPAPGEIWVEPRLLALLDTELGATIDLGQSRFKISRLITFEPDRGGDLYNIAPRIIMRLDEIPATGLVVPASRVRHRLLYAGDEAALERLKVWLQQNLADGQELQGVDDARPELRAALDRADSFLGLAALVSVLLAGVAVALASRRHAQLHLDTAAMLRCLGLSQAGVIQVFTVELLMLGLLASVIGCILGFVAQLGLSSLLGAMLVTALPPAGFGPALDGVVLGLVCLVGFGLPPVIGLGKVPPLRVLRRDLGGPGYRAILSYLVAASLLLAVVLAQARDLKIASYVAGGGLVTVAVLAVAAWGAIGFLGRFRLRLTANAAWRLGLANLTRRPGASVVQIAAFGLGLMVLLLLIVVRQDLLDAWMNNLPEGTPNLFLVNIQPTETEPMTRFLRNRQLDYDRLYPMVRGRLNRVNERVVSPESFREPRAQRLAARDFNLSWSVDLPPGNTITEGRFWAPNRLRHADPEVSVEQGLAQALGLELGDEVQFLIAGEPIRARITSLRQVRWDSFDVNFFVLFAPGLIDDRPTTYISSFYLPPDRAGLLVELIRQFPSVTTIDVAALLKKVRELMDRASLAVEYVFGFTLLAGLVVLFAATQATLDERRHEAAVVRTLGATRSRVLGAMLAEYSMLGLIAGTLASAAALAIGQVIAQKVFGLPYSPSAWLWAGGTVLGTILVSAAGWAGTRSVVTQPPMVTLREG